MSSSDSCCGTGGPVRSTATPRHAWLGVGLAAAALVAAVAPSGAAEKVQAPVSRVGAAAKPKAPTQRVGAVSVEEFQALLAARRGHVLVLNLWASWCAPCIREIPELLEVQQRFAHCGVRVLGLATDDPSELAGPVSAMHSRYFPTFESYARSEGEPDSYASVVDPGWNELMPTTYLIDAGGKTVKRLQGGKSADEFAAALAAVVTCPQAAKPAAR